MSAIKVKITSKIPQFKKRVRSITERALDITRFNMDRRIKQSFGSSPSSSGQPPGVITGRLRGSITSERSGLKARVGSSISPRPGQGASYARYLELGTSRIAARPYLRPALDAEFPKMIQFLKRI